jgi:hypothetical protein
VVGRGLRKVGEVVCMGCMHVVGEKNKSVDGWEKREKRLRVDGCLEKEGLVP